MILYLVLSFLLAVVANEEFIHVLPAKEIVSPENSLYSRFGHKVFVGEHVLVVSTKYDPLSLTSSAHAESVSEASSNVDDTTSSAYYGQANSVFVFRRHSKKDEWKMGMCKAQLIHLHHSHRIPLVCTRPRGRRVLWE